MRVAAPPRRTLRLSIDVERTIASLLEQQARFEIRLEQSHTDFEERQQRTDATLRRAIRLSVLEHRRERARRQSLEEEVKKLAAAQTATQEMLQQLIESLKRSTNGHDTV